MGTGGAQLTCLAGGVMRADPMVRNLRTTPLAESWRYPAGMAHGSAPTPECGEKDGQKWRLGTDADVAWIQDSCTVGLTIGAAIPLVFEAYATILVPDKDDGRAEDLHLLLRLLEEQSGDQPWWLGYLDTGADDVVFPDAPKVTLYASWRYVLVQAGPDEAARWRQDWWSWRAGPDLVFPADRSWLLSWLWDDDWRCIGGPTTLIDRLLNQSKLQVRKVGPYEDATPPGHSVR